MKDQPVAINTNTEKNDVPFTLDTKWSATSWNAGVRFEIQGENVEHDSPGVRVSRSTNRGILQLCSDEEDEQNIGGLKNLPNQREAKMPLQWLQTASVDESVAPNAP